MFRGKLNRYCHSQNRRLKIADWASVLSGSLPTRSETTFPSKFGASL